MSNFYYELQCPECGNIWNESLGQYIMICPKCKHANEFIKFSEESR